MLFYNARTIGSTRMEKQKCTRRRSTGNKEETEAWYTGISSGSLMSVNGTWFLNHLNDHHAHNSSPWTVGINKNQFIRYTQRVVPIHLTLFYFSPFTFRDTATISFFTSNYYYVHFCNTIIFLVYHDKQYIRISDLFLLKMRLPICNNFYVNSFAILDSWDISLS